MPRDYETPEHYAEQDHEEHDNYIERDREDRAERALRRWEMQREMPYEDDEQDYAETPEQHAAWLRREEYGDQDRGED